MKQSWEVDRSKLVRLRETLYRLRAGEDAEAEDSGPLVELPWQVKRRVVVYGGLDSWRWRIWRRKKAGTKFNPFVTSLLEFL